MQEQGPRCARPSQGGAKGPQLVAVSRASPQPQGSHAEPGQGQLGAGLTHHMSPSWMVRSLGAPACP